MPGWLGKAHQPHRSTPTKCSGIYKSRQCTQSRKHAPVSIPQRPRAIVVADTPDVPYAVPEAALAAAVPSEAHTSVASSRRPFLPDLRRSRKSPVDVVAAAVVALSSAREAVACVVEVVVRTSEAPAHHIAHFALGCAQRTCADLLRGGCLRVTRRPCLQGSSSCWPSRARSQESLRFSGHVWHHQEAREEHPWDPDQLTASSGARDACRACSPDLLS